MTSGEREHTAGQGNVDLFAIAAWSSCFMGGIALGPVLGGLLLDHFWWGAAFLIGVPVMVVLAILTDEQGFADRMNSLPKFVASRTLSEPLEEFNHDWWER